MRWLRNIYFSYDGRLDRREFWLFSWAVGLVFRLLAFGPILVADANGYEPTGWNFIVVLSWLLFLWPETALFVKRGHDRGRPAGWSITVVIAGSAISLVLPFLGVFGTAVGVVFTLYVLVDYGLGPGDPGENLYGQSDRSLRKGKPLVLLG